MGQAPVRHLVRNDRFDRAEITFAGYKVTAASRDLHSAAECKFASLRVVVGDIAVIGLLVVESDYEVFAQRRDLGDTLENLNDAFTRAIHITESDIRQMSLQRG